jgi:hypothetical protein
MNAGPLTLVEVLTRRLQVVQEISSAQSRQLFNRQRRGGAEFEIEQIEREIAATGASEALAAALRDARARLWEVNAAMEACDAECAALELQLEDLDRRITDAR